MNRVIATIALACATLVVAPGCGPRGAALTPAEVQAHGTHTFAAPMPKVFSATTAALELEGYEIAIAKPEKGLIKTKRKVVRADAVGNGYAATAVEILRQYEITLEPEGAGTRVTATPSVYVGEADVSTEAVWQLDGPAGERTLWKRLFDDIDDAL